MENGSFVKTGKKLRKQWKNMTLDSLQQMLQSELNKLGSKQEVTLQGISGAQFYYCPGRLQGSYRLVFYKLDTIRDLLTVLSRNENFCGMNKFLVTPVITESHIEIVKASLENKYLGHMFAHRVEYPNRTGFEFAELKYYSSWFKLKMAHNPALYNQQQKTTLINFVLPVYTFTGSFSIRLKRKD
jgi:hypothetical protein